MTRTLLGLFLIGHAIAHLGLAAAPIPNDPASKPGQFFATSGRTWLLSGLGVPEPAIRVIGFTLVALVGLGLIIAGLGVLGVSFLQLIWRGAAVISSILSMVLLVGFWHPWLIAGVGIDAATLIALLIFHWPPETLI